MKLRITLVFIYLLGIGVFAIGQTPPPAPPPPPPIIKNGRVQPPPGYNEVKKAVKKIKFPKLKKPTNPPPPPPLPKG